MNGFVVVCRSDDREGFEYVPATRRIWDTELSANRYASTIAPERYAKAMSVVDYLLSFEGWRRA